MEGCKFLIPGSRFLVLGSQFSVLGSWFPVLSSWFSVLGSWFPVLSSWFSVLSSQFSVLGSQFSVLGSQFSVLGSQFSVLGSWFLVPGSWFLVLTMPGISFDRAVDYYDATRGYPPGVAERLRDAIIAALELSQSAQILEAGVGTGRIAIPFIEAGYFYVGVDLSRRMMGQLRRKLDSRIQRVHLICGDVMHLPVADSTFDAVVMVHVLHLVEDWRQVLNEAHRALRPGAAIVLADDIRGECDCADHTPRAQVQRAWSAILDELNVPPDQRRDGAPHGLDERFRDHLHALGATVERTTLITYRQQPQTVREVARRYQERMYSSCWILPDHIHAEAARRLQHWVNEQCPDPDTPRDAPARIDAMIARRT